MVVTWTLGVLTALLAVVTVWRIVREPRRALNGLFLIATLFTLWVTLISRALWRDPDTDVADLLTFGVIGLGLLTIALTGVYLLVNGAVVVVREGLGISTLVPAVFGVALLGVIGALVIGLNIIGHGPGDHPLLGEVFVFLVAPLCAVPVVMFLVELAAFTVYAVLYGRITRPRRADAVVVLGAGLRGEEPTPLLAARVDRGIAVWRRLHDAGQDAVLVLSGGQGADEVVSEAEAMARYAAKAGVPTDAMLLEDRSTTTEENLANTRDLLADRGVTDARLVVVTSNYHALRAAVLTEQLGLRAQVVGARTASYFVPAGFLREFVAVVNLYRRPNVVVWAVLSGLVAVVFTAGIVVSNLETAPETVDAAGPGPGPTVAVSGTVAGWTGVDAVGEVGSQVIFPPAG